MSLVHSAVYRIALRDLVRSKKALFAALLSLLPMVLAILFYVEQSFNVPYDWYEFSPMTNDGVLWLMLPATIPLVCIILAGGLIADEAEDRTLSYLLVRPIPRQTLYFSRGLAVLTVAAVLVAFQFVTGWLVDGVHLLGNGGSDARIAVEGGTISAAALYWMWFPLGLGISLAATATYVALFGAGSVLFTRYHFFGNLLFFLIWEIGIGMTTLPIAWLSGNHGLRSIAKALDPTLSQYDAMVAADGYWGLFGLLTGSVWILFWTYMGLRIMHRRDFHVTSAAT